MPGEIISRRALYASVGAGLIGAVVFYILRDKPVQKPQVQINPRFDAFFNPVKDSTLKIFLDAKQDGVEVYDNGNLMGKLKDAFYIPLPFGETRKYTFVHSLSGLSVLAERRILTREEISLGFIQASDMGRDSREFSEGGIRYFLSN